MNGYLPGGSGAGVALVGLVLAVVLWQALAAFARQVGAEPPADRPELDAFELELSPTVAAHAASRPYLASRLPVQEIMAAAEPVADPLGAVNTVRWDVPGTYNGCPGSWELVVNTAQKVIYDFNFVR